jgi:hypothetical protein
MRTGQSQSALLDLINHTEEAIRKHEPRAIEEVPPEPAPQDQLPVQTRYEPVWQEPEPPPPLDLKARAKAAEDHVRINIWAKGSGRIGIHDVKWIQDTQRMWIADLYREACEIQASLPTNLVCATHRADFETIKYLNDLQVCRRILEEMTGEQGYFTSAWLAPRRGPWQVLRVVGLAGGWISLILAAEFGWAALWGVIGFFVVGSAASIRIQVRPTDWEWAHNTSFHLRLELLEAAVDLLYGEAIAPLSLDLREGNVERVVSRERMLRIRRLRDDLKSYVGAG